MNERINKLELALLRIEINYINYIQSGCCVVHYIVDGVVGVVAVGAIVVLAVVVTPDDAVAEIKNSLNKYTFSKFGI